jgi:alkylated DNA repair dioxygenase AlkB
MSNVNMADFFYKSRFLAPELSTYFLTSLHKRAEWVRKETSNRSEYYCNKVAASYTYGKGIGERTYEPQPWLDIITDVHEMVEKELLENFEAVFINLYENEREALGWHSDDSPMMDPKRPIVVVSLGAKRDIMFRLRPELVGNSEPDDPYRCTLENGSLLVMPAGFQQKYQHRIPKSSEKCGPRISFTFRGMTP